MKTATRILLAMLIIVIPALAIAQDKPAEPRHFYHLLFRIQDVDANGKVINTRAYSMSIATHDSDRESIRTGSKIPVPESTPVNGVSTQYTYRDIGVNIDAYDAADEGNELACLLSLDISSLAPSTGNPLSAPITRNNRWSSRIIVPIGKPTIVFSSDNLEDKGKIQLELTATPEK